MSQPISPEVLAQSLERPVSWLVRPKDGHAFGLGQFQYSAAPGGAPTIQPNAWFRAVKLGSASFATLGTWS